MSALDQLWEYITLDAAVGKQATRGEWQRALEQYLKTFNGDAVEVSELLDALIGGMKNRYDRGQLSDVEHEYKQLREALEELDRTTCKADVEDEIDAYRDFRAREAGL